MRRHWRRRLPAICLALALAVPCAGLAEELGEMDLYDPSIYVGEQPAEPVPEIPESEAQPAGPAEPPEESEAPPAGLVEPPEESEAPPAGLVEPPEESEALSAGPVEPEPGIPESEAPPAGEAGECPVQDEAAAEASPVLEEGALEVAAPVAGPDRPAFPTDRLSMGVGERRPLPAMPAGGDGALQITYASSKPRVVSVDGEGNLFARKKGKAVITATAPDGATASCAVKVLKAPKKISVSPSKLVLNLGDERALKARLPSKTASLIRWESDDGAVVAVDASGGLSCVGPGAATVTATTFNNRRDTCRVVVLEGRAPADFTVESGTLYLGVGEKYRLTPAVGEGEAAVFAFSSSRKKVAGVSSSGVITARKKGSARITVTTHNGLKRKLKVVVKKAPKSVALSHSALSLQPGESARLEVKLSSGSRSLLVWESSDAAVAAVDADGCVTGVGAGSAVIRVTTFNGKTARCAVYVGGDAPQEPVPEPPSGSGTPSAAKMAANLRAAGGLGAKRAAIASVVELLISAGFEPAFAAGVGANVYAEGAYGLFESSRYITNPKKRPRYFCYLDGGDYYTSSGGYKLTAVYLSREEMEDYSGKAEARLRFDVENFYRDNYSGKYAWEVDLNDLEALMKRLAEGKWEGKFGLGIVQWTGGRTRTLVSFYRRHAGENSATITREQVMAAENEMILYDLKGDYAGVYSAWKKANASGLNTREAARSAGSLVCTRYEIPVDKNAKAVTRGNKAAEIYAIMTGR